MPNGPVKKIFIKLCAFTSGFFIWGIVLYNMKCAEHDSRLYDCVLCFKAGVEGAGKGICAHYKRKTRCRVCTPKGASAERCIHDRARYQCPDCLSFDARCSSKKWCAACGDVRVFGGARVVGGLCRGCQANYDERPEKKFMTLVVSGLEKVGVGPPSSCDGIEFGGSECGTKLRRPDACWLGASNQRTVLLELDEHSHAQAKVSCELAKVTETAAAIKQLHQNWDHPVLCLRVNISGECLDQRIMSTIERIKEWLLHPLEEDVSARLPNVAFFFYSGRGEKHISYAIEHSKGDHAVVNILF